MAGLQDDCFRIGDELMPFDEGLEILKSRAHAVVGMETVSLPNALGRILAEDISAPRDVPPHDNSAVDGYGVRHTDLNADTETRLPVTARIAAGHPLERASVPGEAVQIFTGAPMPDGMDTVFMQEDIAQDGDDVILPAGIKPGANRRKQGEDVREGDVIIETGQMMRAQEIGLAASVGRGEVKVFTRLRAAIFSTGDEVADPVLDDAGPGAIYDANRYTIGSLLRGMGCEVTDLGILPDRVAEIRSALHDASAGHDLIITSGELNANGNTINIGRNWINNDWFEASNGEVKFNGGGGGGFIQGTSETTFHNVTMDNSASTWTLAVDIYVRGTLNLTDGTLELFDRTLTLNGNGIGNPISIGSGTLDAGTSTVVYAGTGGTPRTRQAGEIRRAVLPTRRRFSETPGGLRPVGTRTSSANCPAIGGTAARKGSAPVPTAAPRSGRPGEARGSLHGTVAGFARRCPPSTARRRSAVRRR